MKTFLFISRFGDSLSIAQRVKQEGNRAIFYINDHRCSHVGEGLIEKPPVSFELVHQEIISKQVTDALLFMKPDVVVFDFVGAGFGKLAEQLSKQYPVVGGSLFSDQVEFNDSYMMRLMDIHGLKFPSPELAGQETVELSSDVWYNGREVICHTLSFDENRFLEGDIGPVCRSMGSTTVLSDTNVSIYKSGIGKITSSLKRSNYRGPLSLFLVVTKSELFSIGMIARFKYNSIFSFVESSLTSVSDLLSGVATTNLRSVKFKPGVSINVSMVVKPFPMNVSVHYSPDLVIDGFDEGNLKHIWLSDVSKTNGHYTCVGSSGIVGSVTATGDNAREARRRAYRTIGNLGIPEVMYRRDIGERHQRDYARLIEWGWLN